MATKQEIFDAVTAEVGKLLEDAKVTNKVKEGLTEIFEAHLKPKAAGATVNIDEVTHKDADGNITEIMCSLSGVFLPATKEFFYEDKSGKGINGLKRLSRQAEGVRKKHIKLVTTTERAVLADVLDGKMSPEEGKVKIAEIRALKPDYSTVSATPVVEEDAATE